MPPAFAVLSSVETGCHSVPRRSSPLAVEPSQPAAGRPSARWGERALPCPVPSLLLDQPDVAEGDRVAVEATSKGEHVSGQTYSNEYHFLFEFREGKLLRLKEYMDTERVTDILCGGQRPGASDQQQQQ